MRFFADRYAFAQKATREDIDDVLAAHAHAARLGRRRPASTSKSIWGITTGERVSSPAQPA